MAKADESAIPATALHGVPGDEPSVVKGVIENLENADDLISSTKEQHPPQDDYDSKPETKAGLGNFWRIISYAKPLDAVLIVAATVCAAGAGVTLPLMQIVFGNLVGSFNSYFSPGQGLDINSFKSTINQQALYIVYLFIAKFVLAYVSMFSYRMIGIRLSATIRLEYLIALFDQSISALDKMPKGKPTDLITDSANIIQLGVSDKLALFVQSVALVIGAYVVAFKYCWQLTLVSSSCLAFIIVVYGPVTPLFIKFQHSVDHANEKSSAIANDVFAYMRTVLSLGAEEQLTGRYVGWVDESKKRGLRMSILVSCLFAPSFFAMYSNYALSFWFGIRLYSWQVFTSVGTLVTTFFSVMLTVNALGNIATPIIGIAKASSAGAQFFQVIDAPRLSSEGLKEPDVSPNSNLSFNNVVFAYPSRPTVGVLKGLNLEFQSGKTTAIVGSSGCGKSTIVALLERWYQLSEKNVRIEPKKTEKEKEKEKKDEKTKKSKKSKWSRKSESEKEEEEKSSLDKNETEEPIVLNEGSVLLGETNIEALDAKWWRSQIGLVQQEPFLFNETIYTNIAYGLIGSKYNEEDQATKRAMVEEACKEAFADEFIRRLPQGYDTKVGEGGIKLSGGQRQRIAIARSIIKKPHILVLDEATSSIDVRGERIVQAALDRVSKDRTTIVIAHRLSTIKKADRIVVLKEGRLMEQGTHESLLANPEGVYHNLVKAQNLEVGSDEDDVPSKTNLDEAIEKEDEDPAREAADESSKIDTSGYERKGFVKVFAMLFYEQRHHYLLYLGILVSAMVAGAAYPLQAYIFAHVITVFQDTGETLLNDGNFWALMFFIVALAVGASYAGIGYCSNTVATYIACAYKEEYFKSILSKPIPFYDLEDNSSGSLSSRLSTDPRQIQELLGPNITFPLIGAFNIIGSIAICFAFGWKLTLVILCSATPIIITAAFIRLRFEHQFNELNQKVFSESAQFAAETIRAVRTVLSLTLENTILKRYSDLLDEHVAAAFRKAWKAAFVFALADSIELPCSALGFWYGGQLMATREYDVTSFLIIYMAILQGATAVGQFFSISPNVAQATEAANRILSLRHSAKRDDASAPGTPAPLDLSATPGALSIIFSNLSFAYTTRPAPVFTNLSASIPAGSFIAFVGPSGCGKSTAISLLERFYEPTSGAILINDSTPLSSLPTRPYRTHTALVSQEPTLFEGSIRSNLTLGLPDPDAVTDAQLHAACADAEIHDFIVSLPDGYGTELSGATHGSLSGGQKQRLCIARALLRRPKLLLLDEATSSLDSQSEALVQGALERLAGRREMTIVVVAHRLATVQKADCIFVFGESGKREGGSEIVERGSHAELIAKRGVYWGMCRAQALDR